MTKDTSLGPVPTMSLLAFTSGFVDTLTFIALFGLFAAHVTGNFVLIADLARRVPLWPQDQAARHPDFPLFRCADAPLYHPP